MAEEPTNPDPPNPSEQEHWTRLVIRDEIQNAIINHLRLCPFATAHIEARTRATELSLGRIIGYLIGSGVIGGAAGAALIKHLAG